MALRPQNSRLPPDVNKILFVRNLPFKISQEEMYDLFGKYGAVRQIRVGTSPDTKGTAFIVYEDPMDAKTAQEHLSGFKVHNRYLVVLFYKQQTKSQQLQQRDVKKRQDEIHRLEEKFGVKIEDK